MNCEIELFDDAFDKNHQYCEYARTVNVFKSKCMLMH